MKTKNTKLTIFLVFIHAISAFVLIYTFILKGMFSNVETLNTNLSSANVYTHLSTIIKRKIITHIPPTEHEILTNAIAMGVVNAVVTPQMVEQYSEPLLKLGINWIERPSRAEISDNNLVIKTVQYKQQLKELAAQRDLPDFLQPVGQALEKAVPSEIVIMDLNKRPHGLIPTMVRTKLLYQHVNTIHTIALWSAGLSLGALLLINILSLKRMLKGLSIGYLSTSIAVLIVSFSIPYIIVPMFPATNIDPAIQVEFNAMINDIVNYFFTVTRTPAVFMLAGAGLLYLLYRLSYIDRVQETIDNAISGAVTPTPAKRRKRAYN